MAVEPSVPGWRRCMQCYRQFLSADLQRIRRCDRCKEKDGDLSPRAVRSYCVRNLPKD